MDDILKTIKKYAVGKGVDVSRKVFFHAKNCRRYFTEPDNFYTLRKYFVETADFILCDDIIQKTKYYPIMIKEFFYALKVGGNLIIQYTPKELSMEKLEKELFFLMKDAIDISAVYIDRQKATVVVKKIKPNPSKPDGINYWSFGIVTRGTTDDVVDDIIENIREQRIPHYEIIVCGKYNGKNLHSKDVVYIYFMQKDEKGWITKKKNLICEKARYENLMVMHDRIKLHKGWLAGMKKYGNNFEILSIPALKDGKRTYDWLSLKYPIEDIRSSCFLGSHLEYSDWDKWIYIDGGVIILKKYVWEKVPWDETRYYAEAEDSKLSHDQTRYGFVIRLNPYASCESFRFNHTFSRIMVRKNPKKYGCLKGPIHLIIAKYVRGYALWILLMLKRKFKKY